MAAASEWTGFSDVDLQKIREQTEITSDNAHHDESTRPETSKIITPEAKVSTKKIKHKKTRVSLSSVPLKVNPDPDQMLSPPSKVLSSRAEVNEAYKVKLTSTKNVGPAVLANGMVKLRVKDDGRGVEIVESEPQMNNCEEKVSDERNHCREPVSSEPNQHGGTVSAEPKHREIDNFAGEETTPINFKKISLEEFQLRQKMIEEQNKRRRAMLTKAIADRKKKTQDETEKLTHIQKELQKLDSLVSNDVSILRNQIEVASHEFNEVQKRYEKAEREFVEAKLELFKKMERKERLTEHLCTIIEDNELRKSKKLAELMHELELESLIQECDEDDSDHVLPQLCSLNDITYNYCTTLRDPKGTLTSPTKETSRSHESDSALMEPVDYHSDNSVDASVDTEVSPVSGKSRTTKGSIFTPKPFVNVYL